MNLKRRWYDKNDATLKAFNILQKLGTEQKRVLSSDLITIAKQIKDLHKEEELEEAQSIGIDRVMGLFQQTINERRWYDKNEDLKYALKTISTLPEKDFFTIALNKEHLNTIAFAAQRYTNADLTKPGWTLDFNNKANYELTKTGQYIIFNGVKMNIHKIKFIIEKPIFVPDVLGGPHNAPFTPQGKEYHDTNGGFQIAIQDGQNELVI